MQVGTGKSVLNGIAIGKLKIYKKKDTAISTAPVADTAAELERFEAARQKAIEQHSVYRRSCHHRAFGCRNWRWPDGNEHQLPE